MTLDDVFAALPALGPWTIGDRGQIRNAVADCPLMAVARSRGHEVRCRSVPRGVQPWAYGPDRLANMLGLPVADAEDLVDAAENLGNMLRRYGHGSDSRVIDRLRMRLIIACGIKEAVAVFVEECRR